MTEFVQKKDFDGQPSTEGFYLLSNSIRSRLEGYKHIKQCISERGKYLLERSLILLVVWALQPDDREKMFIV